SPFSVPSQRFALQKTSRHLTHAASRTSQLTTVPRDLKVKDVASTVKRFTLGLVSTTINNRTERLIRLAKVETIYATIMSCRTRHSIQSVFQSTRNSALKQSHTD